MSLSKIQKTFVRLATNQQSYWATLGRHRTKRKRRVIKWSPTQVSVEIVNAVTGEITTAKAYEESKTKLKKWLKLRNMGAEFVDVLLKKSSTFYKLNEDGFEDFPVIVNINSSKFPYLIKRITDRRTRKGKTYCSFLLETVDNVNFLELINTKMELLEEGKKKK